ncbi:DMT family transporter [Planotetraspora kaengkrachanensis]|uniref:Membrane protein n=1 Tax=Planotetraspora kaengkrachanensis TaxID=575193 RepID=A0A8J3M211_9ACTN|nr:EamA family transporter [Planotetraspora kaengkrachanensis]GIG80743.1 membrane protein [Planotetraspora kaengkrachanensis]
MTRVHTLSERQGFSYVLVAAIAWGTGGAAGALLTRTGDLGPAAVSFWRFAIGAALLVAVRRLGRLRPRAGRTGWREAALAGPLMAVCQVAYFASIAETGVALATMITMGATPVLVALGGRVFLRESLGRAEGIAIVLSVGGLLLMTGGDGTFSLGGIAWALLSAVSYAATTLLARASAADPYGRAVGGFSAGALCLLPVAAVSGLVPSHADVPVLAYLGAVPTALAYALFFSGLTRVGATTASVVVLLEPLVAAVIGVVALGERPGPGQVAGGALLLASVVVLARAQVGGRAR